MVCSFLTDDKPFVAYVYIPGSAPDVGLILKLSSVKMSNWFYYHTKGMQRLKCLAFHL